MPWFDFLPKKEYQRWVEKPRFERATEPPREEKESWLTKAFEKFRMGAEAVEQAPLQELRVARPPSLEARAAERPVTPYERRRIEEQVPAQARAGFVYEPETEAARGRLTESLREQHPDWSDEQVSFAALTAIDPGEGFMPMAAWGLAMRPAMVAMSIKAGKATAPVARGAVAEAERLIPRARQIMMDERGGLGPRDLAIPTRDVVVVRDTKGALLREIDINIGNIELRVAGTPQEVIMDMARAAGKEPTVATGRKLVRFVEDFRSMNPETAIVAEGMTPRLAKIYERFGFKPTGEVSPGKIPVLRLEPLKAELGVAPKPAAQAFREATRRPGAPTREEALGRWRAGYEKPAAAPGAPRAGVEPPRVPPTKPPTAEGVPPVPPEDPVGKLTQLIRAAKPVRAETEALKHEVRARQAAQLAEAFKREPGVETARATGLLKGKLPKAAFEPPEAVLSAEEIRGLRLRIHEAKLRSFEELNTRQALDRLLAGEMPTWGDIAKLEGVFGRGFGRALESKMPLGKRVWREFWELTGVPRAVQTAFDLSFHLRQGIIFAARHPKEWTKALSEGPRQFFGGARAAERQAYWIEQKALGNVPENMFVARTGPGVAFEQRAEEFITRWTDRMPLVKQSARAFGGAGNELRGGTARTLKGVWEKRVGRTLTSDEMGWLGRLVNYGTGRGPLPDQFRQVLAGIFYAPGFRTSRPAYLSLLVNPKTPLFVRQMVAEELVAFVGAGTALLTILKLSGAADVEVDPRSTDWGKIQVGKVRLDIWGGTQQMARLVAQLTTGERKTLSTGEIMGITRQDTTARYAQSGLSPQFGALVDVWRGETYSGEPLQPEAAELRTQLWNRMAPMSVQDIVEAVKVEGAIGATVAPFAFLGGGVWSPDIAGVRVNELTQRYDDQGRRKNEMTGVEFDRLLDENPDLAQAYREQVEYAANMGRDWALFNQKREGADVVFEDDLVAALLTPQGRTWRQLGEELGDYLHEWAIRSDQFYGELDVDPRGELGRKIDAYYGSELPTFATDEEKTAYFAEQEKMLEENPDLADAIRDNQILRFTDPDVRRFVRLRWEAQRVRSDYYNIPYKSRMPAEQQDQVRQYVKQAESIAQLQNVPFRRALMQTGIPQELVGMAIRYKSLPTNPARERYWRQYPEKEELYRTFYGDIPIGIEPEMAMAR